MTPEQLRALTCVGKIAGIVNNMNVDALEEYLKEPARDFGYEELCRETIKFVRAVRKLKLPDAYTIS